MKENNDIKARNTRSESDKKTAGAVKKRPSLKKKRSGNAPGASRSELRNKTEVKLKQRTGRLDKLSTQDINKLIHKVGTYQIELEMQNEELRTAQSALEESLSRYADLYDFAPVGYFTFDKNGTILEANLTGVGMLGINKGELIKKPFSHFVFREDQDIFFVHRRNLFESGGPESCELRLKRKEGSFIWVRLQSITADDIAHQTLRCRTTVSDISAEKRAEEALNESLRELERSNRELEQFAYIVSHDLKEPLRMITSYVQLLVKRYKHRLDKNADEYIEYVVDGTNHMNDLLNDLLEYSRVGRAGESFDPVDLNLALSLALANLKRVIKKNNAEIFPENLPTVMASEIQMIQVFQNLIGNAIKFRGEKDPRISVSAEPGNDEWIIRVRDDGIGIDKKYIDRIFQMFRRLHGRGTYPGTGIGLTICKKIVERHGGRIWAESEPGKGSMFCFTIKNQARGKRL